MLQPAFVIAAALGLCVVWGGLPYGQFLTVEFASSDIAARLALAELPRGGQWVLLLDCLFAPAYALVIALAAVELAPYSASPGAGRLLAKAIWVGAAADLTENVILLRMIDNPASGGAALLRAMSVLKFAILIACCGWIGGAAWKAQRKTWSFIAIGLAAFIFLSLFPLLLA